MRIIYLLLISIFAACVTPPAPRARTAQFAPSEYSPYEGEGTGVVIGQAFLKTRGGDVKPGAGELVYLNPVTSYSTEWYERAVIAGEPLAEYDVRAKPYTRTAMCDGSGAFRFERLPAGEYYLACNIFWEVPSGYGMRRTGGTARARVTVHSGEETRAIVTLSAAEASLREQAERRRYADARGETPD